MNIKIGKRLNQPKHKNQFKIVVNFMYGDADGYGEETLFVDKDDKNLERFLKFLNNCYKAYPGGRGGCDDYDSETVEDYWLFCDDYDYDMSEEEEKERNENTISLDWQIEPNGFGNMASYDGYDITFFDENSIEHHVDVTN